MNLFLACECHCFIRMQLLSCPEQRSRQLCFSCFFFSVFWLLGFSFGDAENFFESYNLTALFPTLFGWLVYEISRCFTDLRKK